MLAEFDIKYVTTKFVKGKVVAEYLFDQAIELGEEKDFVFLDDGVMEITEDIWRMYFDGVAN